MSFWCSNLPDFEEVMYGGRTGGARDGSEVGGESPARKYGCRSVAVDAWLVVRNCFFFASATGPGSWPNPPLGPAGYYWASGYGTTWSVPPATIYMMA